MDKHGVGCWGSVTLMTGGRDLLHEDTYVRRGSIDYVKDTISQISEWGGEIIDDRALDRRQGHADGLPRGRVEAGRRVARWANARRTLRRRARGLAPSRSTASRPTFINRHDQALALAEDVAATAASASTSST